MIPAGKGGVKRNVGHRPDRLVGCWASAGSLGSASAAGFGCGRRRRDQRPGLRGSAVRLRGEPGRARQSQCL